jgi:hypothetical protein
MERDEDVDFNVAIGYSAILLVSVALIFFLRVFPF